MSVNPYQPPVSPTARPIPEPIASLANDGPLAFAGTATERDLKRYIASHADVGFVVPAICTVMMAAACLLATLNGSVGGILLAYGVATIVGLAVFVSSRFYRRLSFRSMNPDWQTFVSGELRENGVMLQRDYGEVFLRWDCFTDVVAGKSVIGMATMMELGQSLIIGEAMLTEPADEDRINHIVRTLRRQMAGDQNFRGRMLLALLKESSRERSIAVPENAIAYEGPLYSDDFNEARRFLPRRFQSRLRPVLVMCVLAIGVYMAMLGFLILAMPFDATLAIAISMALLALAIFTYRWKNLRTEPGNRLVQHLLAFADESGITSDGVAITTRFPWSHIRVIRSNDDCVLMCHTASRRVMVAREQMFANATDWQQFKGWVDSKAIT